MSDSSGPSGGPDMGGAFDAAAGGEPAYDVGHDPADYPELDDHYDLAEYFPSPGWDGPAREVSQKKRAEYSKEHHGSEPPMEKELDFETQFNREAAPEAGPPSLGEFHELAESDLTRGELQDVIDGKTSMSRDELKELINQRVKGIDEQERTIDRDQSRDEPGR